jgi:SsrA-binding protein
MAKKSKKTKKKSQDPKTIRNRRATFDYELEDSFVVGMVLNGRETKSLRLGHGQLQGAYVTVKGDELFLINASIHGTKGIPIEDSDVTKARKLLAKRKEIDEMIAAKQQGRTIVPTAILTQGRFIKLRVSLGKGKREYDKRQTMKKRDDTRNAQREIRKNVSG